MCLKKCHRTLGKIVCLIIKIGRRAICLLKDILPGYIWWNFYLKFYKFWRSSIDLYKHVPIYKFYIIFISFIEPRNKIPSRTLLECINGNIKIMINQNYTEHAAIKHEQFRFCDNHRCRFSNFHNIQLMFSTIFVTRTLPWPAQDVLIICEISKREHDYINGCKFADHLLIITKLTTWTATEHSAQMVYYTLMYISYYAHNLQWDFLDTLHIKVIKL